MKTLILNGSPRENGDTVNLINKLTEKLNGEYMIINAYYANISPCIDCRYCWSNDGCSISDEMSETYKYIFDCDNIVIASPIYFSQPTGKLLDVCSRFQIYFTEKYFRNNATEIKPKKGAVILVGGGDGNPVKAYETLCGILHHVNVTDIFSLVGSFNTNEKPASEDGEVAKKIDDLAKFLND